MIRTTLLAVCCLLTAAPAHAQAIAAPTNFVGQGACRVTTDAGRIRTFRPTADTDAARWTCFESALAAMTAGDVLEVGPGTYAAATDTMADLPDGSTLRGAGKGRTTFTTTTNAYPFCELKSGCTYEGFSISQDSATNAGSPLGLEELNTADCTGFVVRDVHLVGDIDCVFFSGQGDYDLAGRFERVSGTSKWDVFRINNTLLTSIDLELHGCDFAATGDPAVNPVEGLAVGLSINAGGGSIRVYGGRFAGFAGNNSSAGVFNEGPGCTVELLGGVRLETSAPLAGDEYQVWASAPIVVGPAVQYDVAKSKGPITYSRKVTDVAVDAGETLAFNPKFAAPTSAAATVVSTGGTYGTTTLTYRVWTYRTINGVRRYSDTYVTSASVSPTNPPIRSITLAVGTDGTEDGIKIGRDVSGGGYVTYREVAGAGSGSYSVTDANSGWTSQDPIVVTPTYDERISVNHVSGSTVTALHAPTLPASLGSLTLATPLAVAQGGTGSSTAAAARTALGVDSYWLSGVSSAGTSGNHNPADTTAYYVGWGPVTGTADQHAHYIPIAGTIGRVRFTWRSFVVLGSTEAITVELVHNNTNLHTVTAALQGNAVTNTVLSSSLGRAVAAGDRFEFKVTPPAWATNPQGVMYTWDVEIVR